VTKHSDRLFWYENLIMAVRTIWDCFGKLLNLREKKNLEVLNWGIGFARAAFRDAKGAWGFCDSKPKLRGAGILRDRFEKTNPFVGARLEWRSS